MAVQRDRDHVFTLERSAQSSSQCLQDRLVPGQLADVSRVAGNWDIVPEERFK